MHLKTIIVKVLCGASEAQIIGENGEVLAEQPLTKALRKKLGGARCRFFYAVYHTVEQTVNLTTAAPWQEW